MKKLLLLLFFFSNLALACDDHPTTDSKTPLWLKYLVSAASKKNHDHKHLGHSHEKKSTEKKDTPKKSK